MNEDEVTLKIANIDVRVPVCHDLATSKAIAAALTDRVREIEAGTKGRVDTTAFALRAAFEFASDLHALRKEQEATINELAAAMDQLLTRLEGAADAWEG